MKTPPTLPVDPLQVGVVFWTGGELGRDASPEEIVSSVASLGLSCGQLAVDGKADLSADAVAAWKTAIEKHGVTVVTCFMGFAGESYASIPECARTVGLVPADVRDEREQRTYAVSDFAAALGVPGIAMHIGCVTHDRNDPDYAAMRDLVRRVCDHAAKHGQTFALETGQEPADVLEQFIIDVDRDNLFVNFDPANMILYGSGKPLEALEKVGHRVVTAHMKDGTWPPAEGEWGSETPLGQGDVDMAAYVAKLKEIGYTGPLVIEREIVGDAQREDILQAIALLQGLGSAG